jgi:uncharacterized membrane-anchored protein
LPRLNALLYSLLKRKGIKTGTAHKFILAPVDPNDAFRGKYIVVKANTVVASEAHKLTTNQ